MSTNKIITRRIDVITIENPTTGKTTHSATIVSKSDGNSSVPLMGRPRSDTVVNHTSPSSIKSNIAANATTNGVQSPITLHTIHDNYFKPNVSSTITTTSSSEPLQQGMNQKKAKYIPPPPKPLYPMGASSNVVDDSRELFPMSSKNTIDKLSTMLIKAERDAQKAETDVENAEMKYTDSLKRKNTQETETLKSVLNEKIRISQNAAAKYQRIASNFEKAELARSTVKESSLVNNNPSSTSNNSTPRNRLIAAEKAYRNIQGYYRQSNNLGKSGRDTALKLAALHNAEMALQSAKSAYFKEINAPVISNKDTKEVRMEKQKYLRALEEDIRASSIPSHPSAVNKTRTRIQKAEEAVKRTKSKLNSTKSKRNNPSPPSAVNSTDTRGEKAEEAVERTTNKRNNPSSTISSSRQPLPRQPLPRQAPSSEPLPSTTNSPVVQRLKKQYLNAVAERNKAPPQNKPALTKKVQHAKRQFNSAITQRNR